MTDHKKSRTSAWIIIGVIVLIVLLFIWLTVADFFGDTDVAAQVISSSHDKLLSALPV